jgi:holdfast attachment protein HfaA
MKKTTMFIAALALQVTAAYAQTTFEGNMNSYETPLGMRNVGDIDSPASARRDENFNRTQVDAPGFGFSATAIGNLINVQTNGSNNTVVINATQVNNSSQNATLDGSF